MPIVATRGHGVTILGAIGSDLSKAVFSLAESTNTEAVLAFLHQLAGVITPGSMMNARKKAVLVLDNHSAHKSSQVKELAS